MKQIILSVLATIATIFGIYKLAWYINTHTEEAMDAFIVLMCVLTPVGLFLMFYHLFKKDDDDNP